jgi:hypothetical protein
MPTAPYMPKCGVHPDLPYWLPSKPQQYSSYSIALSQCCFLCALNQPPHLRYLAVFYFVWTHSTEELGIRHTTKAWALNVGHMRRQSRCCAACTRHTSTSGPTGLPPSSPEKGTRLTHACMGELLQKYTEEKSGARTDALSMAGDARSGGRTASRASSC